MVAPPIEEPPPARNTEVHTPLSLPLPNIPVGGRLAHFAQDWAKITDDKWVLSVIRDGYRIPFLERPILSPDPVFFQQPLSQHLEEEVASLLSKGAVEEIIPECPGHYSRIFLVPKKNGKLRLIIDLSALNHFVYTQTFKMETQRKVKDAVQLNDWAFSLDLTDAYLHIPIHYRSRKFLRVTLRGRVYQFKALPFGLSTSPFVFTRLMEVIATFLRRRAITLHPYLDDWLARNQNHRRLLEHRQFILSLINSLGLIINYEKSDLVPAQVFTFIGMEFLTHTNIVRVPQSRQMKILETVRMFSQKTSVSARDFLSLLGQLNAAADLVMLGRLHLRPLQVSLRNQWRPQNLPYSHQIRMTSEILYHLKWWLQEDRYHQGIPLKIDPPSHTLFTDASLSGWGANVEPEGLLFHGLWTEDQSRLHINVLEMKAIFLSLSQAVHKVKNTTVLVLLYKASGRDSFHRTLRRSMECPEFVLQSQHTAVSEAHTGQVQHSSRPDVQSGQTDLHRVVLESGNSKQSFPDHGLSVNRPVRHTSEPQATILCVTHTGSEGAINRCPIDELESHTRLRVSTVPSHSSCDKQNKVIPVQDSIDSTFMARQTMVSRAPKSVGVITGISASNPKPTCSAKRQDSASKPGPSSASRLGIVKQSLRDRPFSSDVAEHVSKARRESTVKVYDAKWQIFHHWADQRKIDPIQATPQIVADFLTFLFSEKKCQVSTIKGYRSTISNTLKYKTGYDFGSHPVLSELIKSLAIQRPVDLPLAPKWDLAFVLTHMCKAPFEPLDKASLFYLSVKTVFLVTLAMARRVSEVHALSIDSDHLRFSNLDGSLMLRTQVGFLAKNQLPSKAPDSIIIPRLSNYCKSDNFNHMLCPVRALKIYLKRTKSLRKHRKRLFIPIRGDQDLAKSTLSRWVRYVIKHAYSTISKNPNRLLKPRAHELRAELRALSTSWAYVNYIPLEEILKSAVWSSSSLFASHYLRDFREQTENLRAMGPIIAAQKVVGGRANLAAHEDK